MTATLCTIVCPVCGESLRAPHLRGGGGALDRLVNHMVVAHPSGPIDTVWVIHAERRTHLAYRRCVCGFTEQGGKPMDSHLMAYYPNLGAHFARYLLERHT